MSLEIPTPSHKEENENGTKSPEEVLSVEKRLHMQETFERLARLAMNWKTIVVLSVAINAGDIKNLVKEKLDDTRELKLKNEQIAQLESVVKVPTVSYQMVERDQYDEYKARAYSEEDKKKYEIICKNLYDSVGRDAIRDIEMADRNAYYERQKPRTLPVIEGFEKSEADPEVLRQIWADDSGIYPKNWFTGEFQSITYVDEYKEMGGHYGEKVKALDVAADCSGIQIRFFRQKNQVKLPKEQAALGMNVIMAHEIGHANDWINDKDMTLLERVELLLKVIERVQSEDRMKNEHYVEKISHTDKRKELYFKAGEYWGEMCKKFFSEPEYMKVLHPKDYAVVKDFVHRTDSQFNPIVARMIRDQIISPQNLEYFNDYTYEPIGTMKSKSSKKKNSKTK